MSAQKDNITGQIFVLQDMSAEAQFTSVLVGPDPAPINSVTVPNMAPGRTLEVSYPALIDDDGKSFQTNTQKTITAFVSAVGQTK